MESAIATAFQLAILIMSVVLHEVAHGFAAESLGDPTARMAGRLTLNPVRHLDPVGSVLVPLASFFAGGVLIGWARPVPYNPLLLRLRNRDLGSAIVGAAGPLTNIALAVIFGLAFRVGDAIPGFAALAPIFAAIVLTNLALAVFNLIPIPPLDGSKVLFWLLPQGAAALREALESWGFVLLLLVIFWFSSWLTPLIFSLFRFFTGIGPA